MTKYEEAYRELQNVRDWLASINEAARSLHEEFEETLTVNKLGSSSDSKQKLEML